MANYETQIVVIAAGPSGLSAAVQAAEDGAEVIVLEKAAAVGPARTVLARRSRRRGKHGNGTAWNRYKIPETADGRYHSRKSI